MEQLFAPDLSRVRHLVPSHRTAGHMTFVHAVIDGQHEGHVFVDDPTSPRSALVFSLAGLGFALGEPRPDLVGRMLPEWIAQPWISAQPTSLWCTAPGWEAALRPFFREERWRDELHFEPARAPAAPTLSDAYRLQPLDEVLARRWADAVDSLALRLWGGSKRFAKLAFGSGVFLGDALVANCAACAVAGHPGEVEAEIEISTDPAHRQNGLATAAAIAFFEQCRARGATPAWTCDSRNLPSQRSAARLGFREFRKVLGFRLRADALA